eukprot:NODE_4704_length_648_cov_240.546374.p2 GENE.NODE_4704_length_648_cov_240.546374~~NODE_4704_length_648_cov_240.546374.p2  ORF type:complete len:105 (+),score=42.62 NODE_4704_length_648_cov_240.546374:260-574(+)
MLLSALWMLEEGGVLLYTTTSLADEECDGVVARLLQRAKLNFELSVVLLEGEELRRMAPAWCVEATDWGMRVLPDRAGCGPMYFARVRMDRRVHEIAARMPGLA